VARGFERGDDQVFARVVARVARMKVGPATGSFWISWVLKLLVVIVSRVGCVGGVVAAGTIQDTGKPLYRATEQCDCTRLTS
jgi:hypothetical protein